MKKIKGLIIMLLISLSLFGMTACDGENWKASTYEQITAEQAKTIMDNESNYIILDVRSLDEYNTGHIQNAIVIPHDDITEKAQEILKNKEQLILVYCRSGNRSVQASEKLVKLGYTNIIEIGGINSYTGEISANK